MALTGGRSIKVGGYPLCWVETFRFVRATGKYEHTLIVESASGKGHRLVVHLPLRGYSRSRPLLRAWITRLVKAAMTRGALSPGLRRPTVVVTLAELQLQPILRNHPWPERAPGLVRGRRSS